MKNILIFFVLSFLLSTQVIADSPLRAKLDRPFSLDVSDLKVGISTGQGKHILILKKQEQPQVNVLVDGEPAQVSDLPILYSGIVESRGEADAPQFASADFFRGKLRVNFTGHRGRVYQIAFAEGSLVGRVQHFPRSVPIYVEGKNLHSHNLHNDARLAKSRNTRANFNRDVEIALDADYDFYLASGSDVGQVNANVLATVNRVSSIYKDQLGLRMVLKTINVWSRSNDPYNSLSATQRLLEFKNHYASSSSFTGDIKHLLTGVDIHVEGDDSVVGIAYKGVVCKTSAFSYSVTERTPDTIQHLVMAHEFGHNFDAEHDEVNNSIMSPAVSSSATTFSSASLGQIESFIASNSQCLSLTNVVAQKPKIKLALTTVEKKRIRFTVTPSKTSTQECSISLYAATSSARLKGKFTKAKLIHEFTAGPSDLPLGVETFTLIEKPYRNTYFRALVDCGKYSALSKSVKFSSTSIDARKVKTELFLDSLASQING